ncbi:hypothetical protein JHK82_050705 [Glycine max]|nr:hypothetical protein JHK82_050705 [Glycine max]
MHSKAEALEHTKKRDTGHQSVTLDNETGVSTMLKMGDSAKVVIKQDMKGREHKYGFNNNEREKPEKKRVVDDETGDKHELDELVLLPIISLSQQIGIMYLHGRNNHTTHNDQNKQMHIIKHDKISIFMERRHELHKRELDNVVAVMEAQPSLRQTRTKAEGETTIKPWVAKLELWKCNHKLGATPPRNNKSAIYPSSTTPIEVKGFLGISVGNVQVEQEQPLGESGHGSNIDLVGGSLTDPTLHAFDIDNLVLNDNVEDHFSIEEELEDDGDEDDGGGGDIGDYFIKGLMDI